MPELNAAVVPVAKNKVLVASTGMTRLDNSTSVGGYAGIDTSNKFAYYRDLSIASPHVSTSLLKLGLSVTKGMYFSGQKSLVKDFNNWSSNVNFLDQVQTLARLLCRDGTYIATHEGDKDTFNVTPLMMSSVTILPEGVAKKARPKTVMKPPLANVVIDESDAALSQEIPLTDVIYGALNSYDVKQKDILGRDTFGIYGCSLLEPIIQSIRDLISVNRGYVQFVQKYGNGRYLIDFNLFAEDLKKGDLSADEIKTMITTWMEEHKYLKANEDIIGVGIDVKSIDANGTLDVMAFKKSIEADIQIGLLQTPLSMGDTKGSTYAAGYVSEEDRMIALEGIQKNVQSIAQQIINMRLRLMGKAPNILTIGFKELSTPTMDSGTVTEWFNTGIIEKDEARAWGGFSVGGGSE